jgi:hypothetical protein
VSLEFFDSPLDQKDHMKWRVASGLALFLLAVSCGGSVKIGRVGPLLDPRPNDCVVEFLEGPPVRPFVELAELTTKVPDETLRGPDLLFGATRMQVAEKYLKTTACQLGASAVIVSRALIVGTRQATLVSGMAIQWVPGPAKASSVEESELSAP